MTIKAMLQELRTFVEQEHQTQFENLFEVWEKPIQQKLHSGESQDILHVRRTDKQHLILTLGDGESHFREGDMICLHLGDAKERRLVNQATIEAENEDEWLVRVIATDDKVIAELAQGCFADPDTMDLKPFYDQALNDVADSPIGRDLVLPLLAGDLKANYIYENDYDDAANIAEENGFNAEQIDAVAKGVSAKYLTCIQGPPGTGKTKVISLIAKLLVAQGQRVLLTSHTHMAINNALNKVAAENVPAIKVGAQGGTRGLNKNIKHFELASEWQDMPEDGYVIGATPFATCSARLENYLFDTVIFDEASQITLPLAIMAMRKAKRFVFVGDHKQLPPVILSASIIGDCSIFSRLISAGHDVSIMLNQTYRMCSDLSHWPSAQYYSSQLVSAGENKTRRFELPYPPTKHQAALSPNNAFVFIETPGVNARNVNREEAQLVVDIIETAITAGMNAENIGVVTPFRNHAKALRSELANALGLFTSQAVVTDTVERMQGQEREMIIVSLCSSDPQYITAIARFFFQAQRLNVAITRPKTKLILIGPKPPIGFGDGLDNDTRTNIEAYQALTNAGFTYEAGR